MWFEAGFMYSYKLTSLFSVRWTVVSLVRVSGNLFLALGSGRTLNFGARQYICLNLINIHEMNIQAYIITTLHLSVLVGQQAHRCTNFRYAIIER